jgi:hypothetical protein
MKKQVYDKKSITCQNKNIWMDNEKEVFSIEIFFSHKFK